MLERTRTKIVVDTKQDVEKCSRSRLASSNHKQQNENVTNSYANLLGNQMLVTFHRVVAKM